MISDALTATLIRYSLGRPEDALRPAPSRARTRDDFLRWAWKDSRSSLLIAVSGALDVDIVLIAFVITLTGVRCLEEVGRRGEEMHLNARLKSI